MDLDQNFLNPKTIGSFRGLMPVGSRDVDSVGWTALPCEFNDENGRKPTVEEVLAHLGCLTGRLRDEAESYIRLAPRQIDTPYRHRIEAVLHWTVSRLDANAPHQ